MKLLEGRQLYISKHMHSQLLHEDIAQPRPTPPKVLLDPCLTATTHGGQLLDFAGIALVLPASVGPWRFGIRIGHASYLFRGAPPTWSPTHLYTSDLSWHYHWLPPIDNIDQLRTQHWFYSWIGFTIKASIGLFYTKFCRLDPYTYPETTSGFGDSYFGVFDLDYGRTLHFALSYTVIDPANVDVQVLSFTCPEGFNLKLYSSLHGTDFPIWEGGRHADGTYWP